MRQDVLQLFSGVFCFCCGVYLLFVKLVVEIGSRALIRSLSQDQSTVATRAETTVDERYLASCVCARFPDEVLTLCLGRLVSPLQLRCVFRYNLPLAL